MEDLGDKILSGLVSYGERDSDSNRVRKIFTKIFTDQGGSVLTRSKTSRESTPLDVSVDYIIVENVEMPREKLCRALKCSSIGDKARILDCKWIEQCMVRRALVDPDMFEVIPPDTSEAGCSKVLPVEHNTSYCNSSCKRMLDDVHDQIPELRQSNGIACKRGRSSPRMNTSCRTAGVILQHQDMIFMVQPTGSRGYGIPKGRMEAGESAEEAACREFTEETGIPVSAPRPLPYLFGSGDLRNGKPVHAFLLDGCGSERFISSNLISSGFRKGQPENSGGRYFSASDSMRVCHNNQVHLLELYWAYHERTKETRGALEAAASEGSSGLEDIEASVGLNELSPHGTDVGAHTN